MYLMRLALRPWRLAPLSQVSSSLAVALLLVLGAFLQWMELTLEPALARLGQEQVFTAYIDPTLADPDAAKLAPVMRDAIAVPVGAAPVEIKYVGTQEFLSGLRGTYPELTRDLENVGADVATLIPRHLSITGLVADGRAHQELMDQIKSVPGVESVESSRDRFTHIVGAFSAVRWVARALILGLCLALLTGLLHLARTNSQLHQDSIGLLKHWGAGPFTLRAPVILSGLCVGVIGGALAGIGWLTGGSWLIVRIQEISPVFLEGATPSLLSGAALMAVGTICGTFAGWMSAEDRV